MPAGGPSTQSAADVTRAGKDHHCGTRASRMTPYGLCVNVPIMQPEDAVPGPAGGP